MLPNPLIYMTSRDQLFRFFSGLLLFGLLLLADGWLLVRVARRWGVYLALAAEAGTAIIAAVIIGSSIHTHLERIRRGSIAGTFVPYDYARLAGTVTAAVLLLLPGFAGDILGILIYTPPGRYLFAWLFLLRFRITLQELYEYYTLEVYSAAPTTDSVDQERNEQDEVGGQPEDAPQS